jgi:hypothetical protein
MDSVPLRLMEGKCNRDPFQLIVIIEKRMKLGERDLSCDCRRRASPVYTTCGACKRIQTVSSVGKNKVLSISAKLN